MNKTVAQFKSNKCNKLFALLEPIIEGLGITEVEGGAVPNLRECGLNHVFINADGERYKIFCCDVDCSGNHKEFYKNCEFTIENLQRRIDSIEKL